MIGAGKTAMDTCNWLLDAGVDADRIRWIRPRDAWLFNRACIQPLDLVASFMTMQASWVEECAKATDGVDFGHRLEDHGTFLRTNSAVVPRLFRGATISVAELEALRCLERTVRMGKVRRLGSSRLILDDGELTHEPGEIFIDCTAAGVPATATRPVFEPDRITIQLVTIGFVPWSAATIGFVEAMRGDDADKNRLCPTLAFSGDIADVFSLAHVGMAGLFARAAEPDIAAWTDSCRLESSVGGSGSSRRARRPRGLHLDRRKPRPGAAESGEQARGRRLGAVGRKIGQLPDVAPGPPDVELWHAHDDSRRTQRRARFRCSRRLAEPLATGDFSRLAAALEEDVTLRALLPRRFREWEGREAVCEGFTGMLGGMDEYAVLDATVGLIGTRLQLSWRLRVRGGRLGPEVFVVEQQAYADTGPTGRIQSMSLVCSGFCKEQPSS